MTREPDFYRKMYQNKFKGRIHFANYIMKNRRKKKGEHNLQYNLAIWNKNDAFDILNDTK